jgi:hypothetical protein
LKKAKIKQKRHGELFVGKEDEMMIVRSIAS